MRAQSMYSTFFCIFHCIICLGVTATSQPAVTDRVKHELIVQSGETNGVKLTVKMRRQYVPGEAIMIEFTLENDRNDTIILDHDDTRHDIFMKLTTIRNDPVPYAPLGLRFDRGSPYEFIRNLSLHLDPHHTMSWRYNLNDYFAISNAGGYRLSVLRTVDGTDKDHSHSGEDEEVDVGPVRFWVSE